MIRLIENIDNEEVKRNLNRCPIVSTISATLSADTRLKNFLALPSPPSAGSPDKQRVATPLRLGENNRTNQCHLHQVKFYIDKNQSLGDQ